MPFIRRLLAMILLPLFNLRRVSHSPEDAAVSAEQRKLFPAAGSSFGKSAAISKILWLVSIRIWQRANRSRDSRPFGLDCGTSGEY